MNEPIKCDRLQPILLENSALTIETNVVFKLMKCSRISVRILTLFLYL